MISNFLRPTSRLFLIDRARAGPVLFVENGRRQKPFMKSIPKRSLVALAPLLLMERSYAFCNCHLSIQHLCHRRAQYNANTSEGGLRITSTRLFFTSKKKAGKRKRKKEADEIDDDGDEDMGVFETATPEKNPSSEFATAYHAPVMWKECVEAIVWVRSDDDDAKNRNTNNRIIVDGTLGGGGHSQALLKALTAGDVVFGCDVDPDALSTANKRLSKYCSIDNDKDNNKPIFIPVQSNFADLNPQLLSKIFLSKFTDANDYEGAYSKLRDQCEEEQSLLVDGILLDLGVSSHQIDTAERGFAFMKDGPLDMRMMGDKSDSGSAALTAADLCNELDFTELRRIFQVYGDEPRSKAITHSIIERRPLETTSDLQQAVAAVTPEFAKRRRLGRTATLARVFQALRIAVNREDAALEKALTQMAPSLLRSGGRLAVLSYHSMEDRATKRVMRDGTLSKREADQINSQRDLFGNYVGQPKPFKTLGKPQKATEEEIELNSRARSATLRVAERC